MWKRTFISLFIFLNTSNSVALEMKWFGATCLLFEDEKTRLIVDPFVTRVPLHKVIFNSKVESNKKRVKKYFGPSEKKTIIFISHTHYDHILDLPEVLKINPKAIVYGTRDVIPILTANNINLERLKIVKEGSTVSFNQFEMKVFEVVHSNLPMDIEFARGTSKLSKDSGARDFKMESNLSFYLNYKEKKILFHPTAIPREYPAFGELDLLIVGLTSKNIDELKEKIIAKVKAKKVYPVHNDNFFRDFEKKLRKMPFYPTLGSFPEGKLPLSIE